MYRYESDYIMRMLQMLRKLFEYLMGITDEQRLDDGERAIRDAMERLTGITPDAALALSPAQLSHMLGADGEGFARRFAVAELLRARGEMHERLGFRQDAELSCRQALLMYFQLTDDSGELAERTYPAARKLFADYFGSLRDDELLQAGHFFESIGCFADAEDAFCAMEDAEEALAFYRKLLQAGENALEAGGLTAGEVRDGYERIMRLAKGEKTQESKR